MSAELSQQSTGQAPEMPSRYVPAEHEGRVWRRWIDSGAFHAEPGPVLSGERRPYCILIPPPNVTAALHLGHALNNTLQDILTRVHRMRGFETLWMPGTDHAGIATQAVVEKRLRKEGRLKGPLRQSYTRENFIAEIQSFKDEYEKTITDQLKAMGCSCDWERQRFTMDDICARAVREAFSRLFRDGLIYRGKRLVNWDPVLQTAVADDECYDEEVEGAFYYLRYPLVHPHGAPTSGERRKGKPPPDDAVPVTWDELAVRGYAGAEEQKPEEQAWITVATTRPETYLGDTAVAVNPHDPRAKALRGLFVELPLVGRVIPVVEDSYVVLPERYARSDEERSDPKAAMATGFLKVTPAHDHNDYEIGVRHALPLVNVFAPDGTISDKHGWSDVGGGHVFVGLRREDARKKVVEEFKARGLFESSKPTRHALKHSDRSKAVVEPYLSDQWYVKVTDERLSHAANRALVGEQRAPSTTRQSTTSDWDGQLRFHPARYAKTYEQWHDGIRDWCISRQLWWGHRIPVWHRRITVNKGDQPEAGEVGDLGLDHLIRREYPGGSLRARNSDGAEVDPKELLRADHAADRAFDVFVCFDGREPLDAQRLEEAGFVQDPDVLDTWFSSALWPISTMGWPDETPLLKAFNPTTTLCTAREIITLWVSRMVMFNRYFRSEDLGGGNGPIPFRNVFIHSVVQDGDGKKMSKSAGNGVDPLDIIASHGADALRFTLCHMTTQTQDVRMPVSRDPSTGRNTSPKFDLGRNFANKLWNAARFAINILAAPQVAPAEPARAPVYIADRWMLTRLADAAAEIDRAVGDFQFSAYAQAVYQLLWNDFCDWYLEVIKPTVAADATQREVLRAALETILRLLHPVMPFVTEAIHERLKALGPARGLDGVHLPPSELLAVAAWPSFDAQVRDEAAVTAFDTVKELVTEVREVRASQNVKPRRKVTLHQPDSLPIMPDEVMADLCTLAELSNITNGPPMSPSVPFVFRGMEFRLSNLTEAIDAEADRARLGKSIADLEKLVSTLEGRLSKPGYAERAPAELVRKTREELDKARNELGAAQAALAQLG